MVSAFARTKTCQHRRQVTKALRLQVQAAGPWFKHFAWTVLPTFPAFCALNITILYCPSCFGVPKLFSFGGLIVSCFLWKVGSLAGSRPCVMWPRRRILNPLGSRQGKGGWSMCQRTWREELGRLALGRGGVTAGGKGHEGLEEAGRTMLADACSYIMCTFD